MTAPLIKGASGAEAEELPYAFINENNKDIYTFTANEPVSWSLKGGEKSLFTIDKNTTSMISPILDFTSKRSYSGTPDHPMVQVPNAQSRSQEIMMNSGKKGTKRSVSETKKKFVASRQNWKCNGCQEQLNAWFEVDHVIRLEYGGSNHVDNLVALCRECHGKKTTIENL